MVSDDQRALLLRARDLIRERRLSEARVILREMPENATAREWLTKLDALAPEVPASPVRPLPEPTPPAPVPVPARPASTTVALNVVINVQAVRYGVALVIGLLALLMIMGFFAFSWMDMAQVSFFGLSMEGFTEDVDKDPLEVTPLELWIGRNGDEPFIVDLQDPQGGFADVRLIDRTVILLPLAGVVLLWLVWILVAPGAGGPAPRTTLAIMAIVALGVLLYPFVWQDLSDRALEDSVRDSMNLQIDEDLEFFDLSLFTGILTETYSTGEYALLGGLALLAALIGLAAELFTVSRPVDRAPI